MSLITKTNPRGIDWWIQGLQKQMYPLIKASWGVNDTNYSSYGRAYKVQEANGYNPKIYSPTIVSGAAINEEYASVLLDDTLTALSFFYIGDTIKTGLDLRNEATVSLVFFVNLATVYGDLQRNDEEARISVWNACYDVWGFIPKATYTGSLTLKDFPGMRTDAQSKYRDVEPWHYFRIEGTLIYDNISIPAC